MTDCVRGCDAGKNAAARRSSLGRKWNHPTKDPVTRRYVIGREAAAKALGLKLHLYAVPDATALSNALTLIAKARPDALVVAASPLFHAHRRGTTDSARSLGIPAIAFERELAVDGALLTYGPSIADAFRRTAKYVDRILRGAKRADLPVEQATKFDLVITLKTAKALGLTIPPSVLLRADQVIE